MYSRALPCIHTHDQTSTYSCEHTLTLTRCTLLHTRTHTLAQARASHAPPFHECDTAAGGPRGAGSSTLSCSMLLLPVPAASLFIPVLCVSPVQVSFPLYFSLPRSRCVSITGDCKSFSADCADSHALSTRGGGLQLHMGGSAPRSPEIPLEGPSPLHSGEGEGRARGDHGPSWDPRSRRATFQM